MDEIKKPLTGIRVLDIACFIAAPHAASIMGEFGADVIKVEHPNGGDPWRRYGTQTELPDQSLAWLNEARNKKSITLNLSKLKGAELFKEMIKKTDVVCENFRPGTLEKWGLGWEVLSKINPGLILLRVSGYGQTGPYKNRPGFARIAHAYGGLTYLSGMPGEIPVTPGSTSLGDYMTGMNGCIGIMMALRYREMTGLGQVVDCALYESVFRALDEIAPRYARDGFVREPEGTGTLNACPHGHFPSGDGKFLAIACTTDKMFERLGNAMQRPDLVQKYGNQKDRLKDRETVLAEVEKWTRSMPRDDVIDICTENGVPAGAVNSIADIFADAHFSARKTMKNVNVEKVGEVTVPNVFPTLSVSPGEVKTLGPSLGQNNSIFYEKEMGLSENEIHELKVDGVI
jgi:succinyl-CoA:(S)-malate CoA-transferase subunit A/succinyl-CoA:(S)-malate CoA-transferase subunit B|tara:strand:- start:1142 stop:2344 length:1203 start_codon:yes stop_codon:yes gene_type:complete